MELKELLSTILDKYPTESKKPLKDNELAGLIGNCFNNVNGIDKIIDDKFGYKGSPGIMGNWSKVPWLGVFPINSITAQRGIYVVYLFSANHNTVYLSLNQGWTYFEKKYKSTSEARSQISAKAAELRSVLTIRNSSINANHIDLHSTGKLPKGYEAGNIVSISYDKQNMPDNAKLLSDLSEMVTLLNYLLSSLTFDKDGTYDLSYQQQKNNIKHLIQNVKSVKISKESAPKGKKNENKADDSKDNTTTHVTKKDYRAINDIKGSIGDYGEKIVMQIEKENLTNAGKPDLAAQVRHVSKEDGDGLGYDIKSFEPDGKEIWIEVKSTLNKPSTPFMISPNEIDQSVQNPDKFRLYRLYNLSEPQNSHYYVLEGDLNKHLILTPTSFRAVLKPDK